MAKKPRRRRGQSSYTKPVAAQSPPKRPTGKSPRVVDGEYRDPNGVLLTIALLVVSVIFLLIAEGYGGTTKDIYYLLQNLAFTGAGAAMWVRYQRSVKAGAPRRSLRAVGLGLLFVGSVLALSTLMRLLT